MIYKIVQAPYLQQLEAKVNELLDKGWKPIGGVVVIPQPYGNPIAAQSLTLTSPNVIPKISKA